MNDAHFVSGTWEHVRANHRSGGGYLTAFEVAAWADQSTRSNGDPMCPLVNRDVMAAIVARQADLHTARRHVMQRTSYATPAGEAQPALDRLSWNGDRVRVDFRDVITDGTGQRRDGAHGSFHLDPDTYGLYRLDQLGWELQPVHTDARILRPVADTIRPEADAVGQRVVAAVEHGQLSYDAASRALLVTITVMARRRQWGPLDTPLTVTPGASRQGIDL
ncbi:hypothetical protein G1H11_21780 [Phytoactinopolyspora alkaliphila]|uniref:Uncharacterized protein n=1 Tax=Phytoactinopolyspora alkaliphila TaxID=1783498 RepID=A0A6N9YSB2_9ACTN|nr:hypothetical protein [Phytoactinopolyspora alkaliphila]NED97933.1 hypothetical protein [Phytoactinopolyspora alkaliphila]